MDLSSMSDSQLREALVAAGVPVGPITPGTRRLFENKLRRLKGPPEEGETVALSNVPTTEKVPPASTSLTSVDSAATDKQPPISDPSPEPKSYFGVALQPSESTPTSGEAFIFGDRQEALKAVKANPGARFKEFPTREKALKFASQPSNVQNPEISQPKPVPGESSEFRGPKTPELSKFRGLIEKGQIQEVHEYIWSNPRYLISGGDAPVILQEGCRYNALHVCALKNQPEMATMILETLENEMFMARLYPQDEQPARIDRINHMLDLYLNMPNKGNCETPLHFACKFGHIDVVRVLLGQPLTNRLQPNDRGETPEQITCTRARVKSPGLKKQIHKLLHATTFVPLIRPEDKSEVAFVGEPVEVVDSANSDHRSPKPNPTQSPLRAYAWAGPMCPTEAHSFRKKWVAHTSVEKRKLFLSICCTDDEKGQERIGRLLAQTEGIGWREYWEFLEDWADFSTPTGLGQLEDYLERRISDSDNTVLSSNTTLCPENSSMLRQEPETNGTGDGIDTATLAESFVGKLRVSGEQDSGDTGHSTIDGQAFQDRSSLCPVVKPDFDTKDYMDTTQPDDSFNEKLNALEDTFALLTLRSPSAPAGGQQVNPVENVNPWREKCHSRSGQNIDTQDLDAKNDIESLGGSAIGRDDRAPGCVAIPELNSAVEDLLNTKTGLPMIRKKSDLESEGSDFISCASYESDQSFETYYTAAGSPSRTTPPHTPTKDETPVFILGPEPTKVDSDVLHAIDENTITPEYPNISRWHKHVTAFSEEIRNKWSSPYRRASWSTSQREGSRSRLTLHTPGHTPTSHTPSRTFGRNSSEMLSVVRTNLMQSLSDVGT